MLEKIKSRHDLVGVIILLYLLPILLLCTYSLWVMPLAASWSFLALGLLLSACGALFFFMLLFNWQVQWKARLEKESCLRVVEVERVEREETPTDSEEKNNEIEELRAKLQSVLEKEAELLEEVNYRNDELRRAVQENEHYQRECEQLKKEYSLYKEQAEETLESEKIRINEYQETISELRAVIESKQESIDALETKIGDLKYEIKTLLQLADMTASLSFGDRESVNEEESIHEQAYEYQVPLPEQQEPQIFGGKHLATAEEAGRQLKRCIDIAQKITHSPRFGGSNSRFREFPLDNYALDLRRLCDSLSTESAGTVLVFSQKEKKLLFTNQQIKHLLGWSPEKFMQDFDRIVQEGMIDWKSSVSQLNTMKEAETRLVMKAKSGEDILIHCRLGMIPTGVFRSNVIAVLYPA